MGLFFYSIQRNKMHKVYVKALFGPLLYVYVKALIGPVLNKRNKMHRVYVKTLFGPLLLDLCIIMALLLFGLVAVAGLRLILSAGLDHRNSLIVAVSLGIGLGAPTQSHWLEGLPSLVRTLLESGVSAGGIAALVMNTLLPGGAPPEDHAHP